MQALLAFFSKFFKLFLAHIKILEWFKNFNFEIKYSKNAIDNASKNGAKK